jgi:peptidyl-prolyl cis-trans isomerase B (cyclophilin B)
MFRLIPLCCALLLLCFPIAAPANPPNPKVQMETSLGEIVLELDAQAAPKTVANFLAYVHSHFYDNTIFHRVIKSFMIQGGGFTPQMQQKITQSPIINEADNGLKNDLGTIAMARSSAPHSATSQFFINVKNNDFLNYSGKNARGWGYCVFGRVIKGIEVVHAIENVKTTSKFGYNDVPVEPVVVKKAVVLEPSAEGK